MKNLKTLWLHDLIKTIEPSAFSGCTSLEEVVLPCNLHTLGQYAFRESGIRRIEIPDTLHTLDKGVFYNCKQLSSVTLPVGFTTVGPDAFANSAVAICPRSFVCPFE